MASDEKTREETLHRLLAGSLRLGLGAGSAGCPGPDVLATYFDRSLSPLEASHWESHFSACARCQQVLAALATSELAPASVAEERVAAAATQPQPAAVAAGGPLRDTEKSTPGFRRYLSWRWLVPAVAAAAALAVWLAVRPTPPPKLEMARENQVTSPATEIAPQLPVQPPKELAQNPPLAAQGPKFKMATKATPPSKTLPADAARGREVAAAATEPQKSKIAAAPPAPPEEKTGAEQDRAGQRREAVRAAAAPGSAGEAAELSASKQAGGKAAEGKLAEAQPGAAVFGAATPLRAKANRAAVSSAPVLVVSPTRAVLWRIGAGGRIERSRDAGRTWQAQASNADADLLAGSAPAETVCWLVGRAGTILRTLDGEHWEKISSPAAADWTAVKAQDGLHASISAAGGETYATKDGGRTWQGPAGR
jgi:hypothetical protein